MSICFNYDYKIWHFIIPPTQTIYKLCISSDKTKLFLVTLMRFIIVLYLFDFFYTNNLIRFKTTSFFKYFGFIFLLLCFIFNLIILILVFIKMPILNEKAMNTYVGKQVDIIENSTILDTELEKRTAKLSEAEKTLIPETLNPPYNKPKSIS